MSRIEKPFSNDTKSCLSPTVGPPSGREILGFGVGPSYHQPPVCREILLLSDLKLPFQIIEHLI